MSKIYLKPKTITSEKRIINHTKHTKTIITTQKLEGLTLINKTTYSTKPKQDTLEPQSQYKSLAKQLLNNSIILLSLILQ